MEVINRYVVIKDNIDGAPQASDFEVKSEALSVNVEVGSSNVIVKNLYVSIDPHQINRMKSKSSSLNAINVTGSITPGQAISAYGVGKVVASGNPEFNKDDLVVGFTSWGEYSVVGGDGMLRKLDSMGFPLSYHVGILGLSGLTAYGGFFKICKPKKGEKVFGSAASGSVGNLVGQYAKLFGCYVVGCAGTKHKVEMLKEELGFDDAFNYKEKTNLKSTLKIYFPNGIDIYFDNVGAETLEAAVDNMNVFGRIAVCGVISEYIDAKKRATPNMLDIVYKRISMQGFLALDHMDVYSDFVSTTGEYLSNGKIHVIEDISEGVKSIVPAFMGLYSGNNIGKKIVRVACE